MLNRIVLIGRLTRDPELRYTPNGVAVTTFTLAVDRPFTNNQGERETDFINIVTWRGLAENCANYLKKGRLAAADGRLQIRNYEQDGQRKWISEVVAENLRFLESAQQSSGGSDSGNNYPSGAGQSTKLNDDPFAKDGKPIDISDDDLPF
jgi:single-strand DNA-binding protein